MTSLDKLKDISRITESKVKSFRDAGFDSLEDLKDLTEDDLEYIDGVGPKKLNKIYRLLDREGIQRAEKDENYLKFRDLLEKLFQFESADLDFGVHRILNEKRGQIEKFLDEELESKVQEELEEFKTIEQGDAKEELEEAKEEIRENFPQWTDDNGNIVEEEIPGEAQGIAREHKERYFNAKEELGKAEIGEEIEAAIYQDLYRFFKRYYKDGDFIPQRRAATQEKYAIPYNGEEVKLHWANKDQFFVKTGERFKDYKFRITEESYEIEFKLRNAEVEKTNKKGDEKYFVLREEESVQQDGPYLKVNFEYRSLTQDDYDRYDLSESSEKKTYKKEIRKQTEEKILNEVSPSLESSLDQEVDNPRSESSILHKHLKNYITKNEKDYFIHKDLDGFLRQELDFYLKNEVFSWKEMTDNEGEIPAHVRARLNAIENIAGEIIDFIAQIENFQKKLWKKKKFVVQTDYCVTLDEIQEKYYSKILENDEQIEEWKELYDLEEDDINEDFVKDHQSMMVDTKFFNKEFKYELLSNFNNLNQKINGLLIKSENYHALQNLMEKYRNKVKCIYIDPPYNTGKDDFIFKDDYRHSSWLSMMRDRLKLAYRLLKEDGLIFINIDDNEQGRLKILMNSIFGEDNFLGQLIWNLGTGTSAGHFTRSHEYVLVYSKNKLKLPNFEYRGEEDIIRERAIKKISDKNPPTEITFPAGMEFEGESATFSGEIGESEVMRIKDERMEFENGKLKESVTIEAGWAMRDMILSWINGEETYDTKGQKIKRFFFNENGRLDYEKIRSKINPKTVISDVGSTKRATSEINNILDKEYDNYPKPTDLVNYLIGLCTSDGDIVMDFFAGSGTTGHAVTQLNRCENEKRRYILVEFGDYFYTLMKPRLQKVIYSSEWNKGKPKNINEDFSNLIKYFNLEQYEDTLENLDLEDEQAGLDEFTSNTLEYFLNFDVDGPSLLDLDDVREPFDYTMNIREDDESNRKNIDLVETFNHLLGLNVHRIRRYEKQGKEYRIVKGEKEEERDIVVIWRPVSGEEEKEFFEEEREFLNSEVLNGEDSVYINYDSALENSKSIEKTFQKRMWE